MRTEQELKEVNRLANYFQKVIEESAKTMKYYDVLNTQYNALWEYCEERIECSDAEDRMRVMKDTETYFKTIAKIIILEQKAEAYIQFG
jgi:Zn-dependent M32 family carboxypeptidase